MYVCTAHIHVLSTHRSSLNGSALTCGVSTDLLNTAPSAPEIREHNIRRPSIESTNPSCPINGHNLWDSSDLYGSSQRARRPIASPRLADNLNTHTSDKEKSSDGNITGVILKWKCYFIMKANRINLKLLLQKLRAAPRVRDNVNSETCSAYCADCLLLFGDSNSRSHFYSWPPGGSEVTLKQDATARCGVKGSGIGNIWSSNVRNNWTVRRVHPSEMWSFTFIYET